MRSPPSNDEDFAMLFRDELNGIHRASVFPTHELPCAQKRGRKRSRPNQIKSQRDHAKRQMKNMSVNISEAQEDERMNHYESLLEV